jgi:hypothetical protein
VQERTSVPAVEPAADPGLRWYQHEEPEDERQEQPLHALDRVLADRSFAQREVAGCAGEQEQQRHMPYGDERQHGTQSGGDVRALHVERVARVEHPGHMEWEEQEHGEDAEPIDVVDASLLDHGDTTGI